MGKLDKIIKDAHVQQNMQLRQQVTQLQREKEAMEAEMKALKMEHKANQRVLSVHEKREKRRADGLKKAQKVRKKNAKA